MTDALIEGKKMPGPRYWPGESTYNFYGKTTRYYATGINGSAADNAVVRSATGG